MTFSEIIKENKILKSSLESENLFELAILTNITVNQLSPYLEYGLRSRFINADCIVGEYDNIVQDSSKYTNSKGVIIFWEAANILDGLHYKINNFTDEDVLGLIDKVKKDIYFVLTNLAETPLIIFNLFTSRVFNYVNLNGNKFDYFCDELNSYLKSQLDKYLNLRLVNLDNIIAELGVNGAVDFRNYYNSKSLYTTEFIREYTNRVLNYFQALNGKSKKILVLDCDNTLWGGILGEDGIFNLKMNSDHHKGVVFEEIQNVIRSIKNEGILLAICSKNNFVDVENVFCQNKSMILKFDDFVNKKINWDNKVDNIKRIASELNIGLDSFVFVDDSDFEIDSVRNLLAEVTTFQVPKLLYEFPISFKKILNLFTFLSKSNEDLHRSEMYLVEQSRSQDQENFTSVKEYLASLSLNLTIRINELFLVPRVSQLTLKTNQFNLTTKRYSESDISGFIKSGTKFVLSADVEDRFGKLGLTGVCIVFIEKSQAIIDSFLLSCRILGREIEIQFFLEVVQFLRNNGVEHIIASYSQTSKNSQVADFYNKLGFVLKEELNHEKIYELNIKNYKIIKVNHIEVNYE